jgi:hypothetical protein
VRRGLQREQHHFVVGIAIALEAHDLPDDERLGRVDPPGVHVAQPVRLGAEVVPVARRGQALDSVCQILHIFQSSPVRSARREDSR